MLHQYKIEANTALKVMVSIMGKEHPAMHIESSIEMPQNTLLIIFYKHPRMEDINHTKD